MIEVTQKAVRATVIIKNPGWYILDVKDMEPKPAKTDGSTNFNYKMEIVSDIKGDKEYEGVRVKDFLINEKGVYGSGIAFYVATGAMSKDTAERMKKREPVDAAPVDENQPVGTRIRAFLKVTEFDGRKSNEATDFLPL